MNSRNLLLQQDNLEPRQSKCLVYFVRCNA
nr:MAG TPA: hypothetical protein [Caudoviricetes sp.]DAU56699.1 MAG TPA: hypothetical protein [Caudoviricetes sp.]